MGKFWANDSIFDRRDLNKTEKLVLLNLHRRANARAEASPGYKRIAKDCGISRRSAIRAIAKLEAKGLIIKQKRKREDGGDTSNLYIIVSLPQEQHVTRGGCQQSTTKEYKNYFKEYRFLHKKKNKPKPDRESKKEYYKDIYIC